jgi:hypothetical protein
MSSFSYVSQRLITLEELIFSSKLETADKKPFWSENVYEYSIKKFRIKKEILANGKPTPNEENWVQIVRPSTLKKLSKQKKEEEERLRRKNVRRFQALKKQQTTYNLVPANDPFMEQLLPHGSTVIVFRSFSSSIYEIYYKTPDERFYFMVLSPVLNTVANNIGFYKKKRQAYNCFGHSFNLLEFDDKPVFKVKWIALPIPAASNFSEINMFKTYYSFPLIPLVEIDPKTPKFNKGTEETKGFVDLRKYSYDETKFSIEKYLVFMKHIMAHFSFLIFSLFKASKKIKPDEIVCDVPTLSVRNNGANCYTSICNNHDYNYRFELEWSGKEYVFIVNQHKLRELETSQKDRLLKEGQKPPVRVKYVVWLFFKDSEFNYPDRLKNISDIDSYELLDAIISILRAKKLYNEHEDILGYNTFTQFPTKSFHFHIFKKKDVSYYQNSVGERSLLGIETRMTRLLNLRNKLKAYPRYFKENPGLLHFGAYQPETF